MMGLMHLKIKEMMHEDKKFKIDKKGSQFSSSKSQDQVEFQHTKEVKQQVSKENKEKERKERRENREKQKLQEIAEQVRTANSQLRETVWSIRNESIDAYQLISQIQCF